MMELYPSLLCSNVSLVGFEPTPSCPPDRRPTKLAYRLISVDLAQPRKPSVLPTTTTEGAGCTTASSGFIQGSPKLHDRSIPALPCLRTVTVGGAGQCGGNRTLCLLDPNEAAHHFTFTLLRRVSTCRQDYPQIAVIGHHRGTSRDGRIRTCGTPESKSGGLSAAPHPVAPSTKPWAIGLTLKRLQPLRSSLYLKRDRPIITRSEWSRRESNPPHVPCKGMSPPWYIRPQ